MSTRRAQQANLAEVVRLDGLRTWVEQGYKQVKGELGWADFQVRSDRAIRRHWTLVCCAFSFCWQALLAEHPGQPAPPDPQAATVAARGAEATGHRRRTRRQQLVAGGGAGVADPLERSGAAGGRGHQHRRPGSYNGYLTLSPQVSHCTLPTAVTTNYR
jgi:hypothetical protein